MASGSGSSVVIDLDASVGNRSTSELISALKSCFRESDFARVESILIQREEKLKEELETLERVNEWLKYQRESSGMENMKVQKRCEELQQLNTKLIQEKNEILERERRAVDVAELWQKKYEGLRPRILKLEDHVKLLASMDPKARVYTENGNYAEGENGTGNANDLVRANVDRSSEDNRGPPSRCIVQLSDSDDDSASGEILSRNGPTSHGVAESDCPSQMDVQCRTRLLKRKQDSCTNVSENNNCKSECVEDADVHGTSFTADYMVAKIQKLIYGNDGSLVNRCSEMAVSSRSNNAEKICPPSSQEAWILRQCEEKMGSECISKNLTRGSSLNVPALYNIDDSSNSSSCSSSSGSESDVDLDFDFPQLTRTIIDKKWESESHMFAAFEKDNELYLKAVCALYRHQTAVEKLPSSSVSSNNREINQFNTLRGSNLAEFLIDGDPQGNLKKSVSELLQYDPKGLDDCKKIASDHSKQLFEIYQKTDDPLFMS